MPRGRKSGILLALEVAAISAFIWHELIFEPSGRARSSFGFALATFTALLVVLAFVISRVLKAYVSFLASWSQARPAGLRESVILTLSPFLLLALTFLQSTLSLNSVNPALLAVSCLGFVYLQMTLLASLQRVRSNTGTAAGPAIFSAPKEGEVKPLARRLFLVTALVYVLYLSGLTVPALPFTGDEPHYLLIAKSLVSDGDINLSNNYLNKDYLEFYPGALDPHAYPGKKGERHLYSKHQPALSVLAVPFYFLGERLGKWVSSRGGDTDQERRILVFFSRLPVCFLAALLSLAFFLFVWELTRKRGAAILSWLVFSFTPPLLFFSHLLYPEIPVALILLLISLRIIQKKDFSLRSLFGTGIGLALLPWFGLKYIVLAAAAALIVFFLFLSQPDKSVKKALSLTAPVLLSAGLYLSFLWHLYGNLSPQAVYLGTAAGEGHSLSRFMVSDPLGFLSRLLGYLFDQRAGVFAVAPVYILLLPGLFLLARRFKKATLLLAALFSVFWAFCALNSFYWGGYCPPARPLLPVLWIPALFMAGAFAFARNRVALVVRNALVAIGFAMAYIFIRNPGLLFQESLSSSTATLSLGMGSEFLARFKSAMIDWRALVPSLSSPLRDNIDWMPLLIWIPAVLGIAALFLLSQKQRAQETPLRSLRAHLGGVAFLSVLFAGNAFLNIGPEKRLILEGPQYEVVAQDENTYPAEPGGFWVRGRSRAALIIRTLEPATGFSLSLSSPIPGKTKIRLAGETKQLERGLSTGLESAAVFLSPRGFRWRGHILYRLQIEEESGFYPWKITPHSQDSRFLGTFIKIEVSFPRSGPG